MPGRSIRVARIAGIPVGVSPLWLIIVALITWSLGAGYYPHEVHGISPATSYALGLASALLLFASILAHEFGHALVARSRGLRIEEIDLWLLGGVARMSGRPRAAADEFRFAIAGPLVTMVVALLFAALLVVLPHGTPAAVRALVRYQAEVNALILAFNLLPAFPLDGGRVTRAILWRRSGDIARATESAARLGRVFGYILIAGGILLWTDGAPGGLWFAVIGFFLVSAATAEVAHERMVSRFAGLLVADVMSSPVISIPAGRIVADAARDFERYRYTSFPVVDDLDRPVGLLSIGDVERTPRSQWDTRTVQQIADGDPELRVMVDEDATLLFDRPRFLRVGRAVAVDATGTVVGLVSVSDLERMLRAEKLRDRSRPPASLAPHDGRS